MAEIELLKKERRKIFRRQGVVGHYLGKQKNGERTPDEVLTIFVRKKLPEDQLRKSQVIPKKISTYRTDVIETGEMVAETDLTARLRPVKLGSSIGNKAGRGTGSLGPTFRDDPFQNKFYGGSNSHVLFENCHADINQNSREIIQPGIAHSSDVDNNVLGKLAYGTKINAGGYNTRDSAGFEFYNIKDADPTIPGIGIPEGIKELQEGEYGRLVSWKFTGKGKLTYKNATVRVNYNGSPTTFSGVDLFERMSQAGTSGTGIVTDDGRFHSHLNFAGSPSVTVAIPFHQAWAYGKTLVTKDWWEDFTGGGEEPPEPGPEPPEPPDDWSLRGGGLFLFALGCYIITKADSLDLMLIGIALIILGLAAIFIGEQYGISKKDGTNNMG